MDSSYGQRTGYSNSGDFQTQSTPHNDDTYIENGLHPVPPSDKIVNLTHAQYDIYRPVPISPDQGYNVSSPSAPSKKRICGLSVPVFILWCILGFLVAILVIIAGVFGSMLARQNNEIMSLKSPEATSTTNPEANGTSTSTSAAAATTWVEVNDWEFIGCWEDGDERIFPDKNTQDDKMTNRLCAAACVGYEYFGSQFGDQCYCSRTPPKTQAPAWNCDMHCKGAPNSEICGGYYFLSTWKRKS